MLEQEPGDWSAIQGIPPTCAIPQSLNGAPLLVPIGSSITSRFGISSSMAIAAIPKRDGSPQWTISATCSTHRRWR